MPIYFITAIDTDAGKTVATGLMAAYLASKGKSVITAKPVQTGCLGISEDIAAHRQAMGTELLPEDTAGLTCPYVFSFPASPHLSAEMEGCHISAELITGNVRKLAQQYEYVLVEGAGGLLVPLTRSLLLADMAAEQKWKCILVTSGRLGSINHSLLSFEAIKNRGIDYAGTVYNHIEASNPISQESSSYIRSAATSIFPASAWAEIPFICKDTQEMMPNFSGILNI
jgi:dethiobiotin synthetase